ncbi:MAG: ABC transporter substrate-binding protein [Salinivirgaceae bacterium]|jgi:NitT/TauT family transport system substrate-binding protein
MKTKINLLAKNNSKSLRLIPWSLLKNYIRIAIVIIPALFFLTACKEGVVPPMRIGMHVWPGFEPLFLARQGKSLDERDFRLVEFSNGSEVGRAFRNGTLEAACLTLDEIFYMIQDGMDPVILIVMDDSYGADAVLARPEIKDLSGLKNKRIAVEVSAVEAYMLTRSLQKAGLTINDVTPVYLPIEKHILAYKDGLVDAVVTYEPVRTKLLAMGAVEVFNSSMIPGEIVDVLVVHRDYLEGHPERGISLKKAWFAALEQMHRSPRESAKFMAIREQITTEEFEKVLQKLHFPNEQENQDLIEGAVPKLMVVAENLKTVMLESGLLHENIPIKPLFVIPETMKTER